MADTVKKWWQSKLIWAGIVSIVVAAYNQATVNFPGIPAIPDFVFAILGAFGVWNRATSDGFKTAIK